MNRVAESVERMRTQIEGRIRDGLTTAEKVEVARKALDMDIGEYVRFQELKSVASVSGTLTLEEGQYIYSKLGMTPEHFNRQDAATKTALTMVFRQLLERSLSGGQV